MKHNICFLLTVLILLSVTACGNKKEGSEIEKQTDAEITMTLGIVEEDVFEIKTDYCTLKYPNEWKDKVNVEVSNNIVSFVHIETGTRVFDIVFGDGEGDLLGIIKGKDSDIPVKVLNYEFNKNDADYETLCAISWNVNVILNNLAADYDFEW